MSSDSWNSSAEAERIKNRKQRLEEKRKERAESNPDAFGWEKKDGKYVCLDCDREFSTLPGCIEHINNKREPGQSSIGDWA